MSYFYAEFLAKPVDGTEENDESRCGENIELTVSSFSPTNKESAALGGLSHKPRGAL